ncbi:MAG: alcohol dehydrogenase catalytic domain-containing protein [Acidimicrobiales bacterium]|nr:alcohol dehydrogenase catalytic domain-containing protein [Acidimicrobiales bacterium]
MKAALITEKETISFLDFDDPEPESDQVVVDITLCGICGTDIHGFNTPGPMRASICGHEWTGIVSKTGNDVARIKEGDRVVVAVPPSCGSCVSCQAGQMDKCKTVLEAVVATGRFDTPHGGFAPRIAVNHWRTVVADSRLSDVQAAQIEPTTICFHAVRFTPPKLGDVVVVQGAGPIGLTTLQWAQVAGAETLISVEPDPVRREVASGLGANYTVEAGEPAEELVKEVTAGLGADVVYECAGVSPALQSAVDLARRGGTVSLIGLASSDALTKPGEWLRKEINVSASLGYTHEEFEMSMSYVAESKINLEAIHTGTVPLGDIGKAFTDLSSGTSGELKILVDPR